jgi:hypothetical protein
MGAILRKSMNYQEPERPAPMRIPMENLVRAVRVYRLPSITGPPSKSLPSLFIFLR